MYNRYRNYCFTAFIEPNIINKDDIQYYIYQTEKCPSTNKIHYQGYIEFKKLMSYKMIKELFNDSTIHLEPRKGTQEQAINYCKKCDTRESLPVVFGVPKRQGQRTDLDSIYEGIESGMTAKELLHEFQGHAVKHINLIITALKVEHNDCLIDKLIEKKRLKINDPQLYKELYND